MKPSAWKAFEPTTAFSAIVFHCWTVFPGGNADAAMDIGRVSITIASAMERVGMVLLPILHPLVPPMGCGAEISGLDGHEYKERIPASTSSKFGLLDLGFFHQPHGP